MPIDQLIRSNTTLPGMDPYKIAVDNFKAKADFYFLSHFHADHYRGLNRKFRGRLYCTSITKQLVRYKFNVPNRCITVVSVGDTLKMPTTSTTSTLIPRCSVTVTVVNANHCPGAVMLLFTKTNAVPQGDSQTAVTQGTVSVLHTGDFRMYDGLRHIDWPRLNTLVLDNTYQKSKINFPSQDIVIQEVCRIAHQHVHGRYQLFKWLNFSRKVLIVFGNYTIGKEKLVFECAKTLDTKVYIPDPQKRRIVKMCFDDSFVTVLEESECVQTDCVVHLVSLRHINFEWLERYLTTVKHFTHIVAFRPSGWTATKKQGKFGVSVAKSQGRITIHNVMYSEHCSYDELLSFIETVT